MHKGMVEIPQTPGHLANFSILSIVFLGKPHEARDMLCQ